MQTNTDTANASAPSALDSAADGAKSLATSVKDGAAKEVRATVDSGRQRAAEALQQVARTLQGNGEGASDAQSSSAVNNYVMQAGSQLQSAADYLRDADVRELVTETENFARRQPALFLGGAFTIGLLAARMLKSGKAHGEQSQNPSLHNGRSNAGRGQGATSYGYGADTRGANSSGWQPNEQNQDRELSRSVTREQTGDSINRSADVRR